VFEVVMLTKISFVSPALAPTHRAALYSVRLMFFLNGALFATWASRIPTVKDELGLSDGGLAVAFAGQNLGAVLGLQLGGLITTRFGSRATLRLSMPLFAVSLSSVLLAGDLTGLTAALIVFAVVNSVVDVGMNAHGFSLSRVSGWPLLSGINAYHSLGMISGSLVGVAAEYATLSIAVHFAVVSALVVVLAVSRTRPLLPSSVDAVPRHADDKHAGGPRIGHWPGRLILLGGLAFCVALAEGAANDWAAVYLRDEAGASPPVAAAGFALFVSAMFVGRLIGDRLVARFGPVRPFLAGTLSAAAGIGMALIVGGTAAGLVGLALFGLGLSYTFPVALGASGSVPGIHPSRAIAMISTIGYLGFFTGPTLIGVVAEATDLRLGLTVPVLFLILAAFGARALRGTTAHAPSPATGSRPRGSKERGSLPSPTATTARCWRRLPDGR
jgi:fucose permease